MNDILGADIAIFGRGESTTAGKLIASSNEFFYNFAVVLIRPLPSAIAATSLRIS